MKTRVVNVLMLLTLLSSTWLTTSAQHAYACTCQGATPEGALQGADAVFVGKIVNEKQARSAYDKNKPRHRAKPISSGDGTIIEHEYDIEVSSTYKGITTKRIRLYDISEAEVVNSCNARRLHVGETYFIYANYDGDGELYVDIYACARTRPLTGASEDIQALGIGSTPGEPGDAPISGSGDIILPIGILVAALVVLTIGLIIRQRIMAR